jgi:two-component system chemotaxis response regulator CheB
VLAGLLAQARAAVVVVQHGRPTDADEPGIVYLSRSDLHLTVTSGGRFEYMDGTKIRGLFSSANPLFESAARVYDGHTIGVVLTGGGRDATDGRADG